MQLVGMVIILLPLRRLRSMTQAPIPGLRATRCHQLETTSFGSAVVNGVIYAIGGADGSNSASATNEAYTPPSSGTWTEKAPMPTARGGHATAVANGVIYAIGGHLETATWAATSTVDAYNPATNSWTTKAPMPTARQGLATVSVNGVIYAIGGWDDGGNNALATVEAYDPATNTWTAKAPMPTARAELTAASVNGVIYAIGGGNTANTTLTTVEAYDPLTDTWSTVASMPTDRIDLASVVVDGVIYAIGGWAGTPLSTVESYDPVADHWTTKAPLNAARGGFSAGTISGLIYAIGGDVGSVEVYDPSINTWSFADPMPTARFDFFGSAVVGGVIYAMGGEDTSQTVLSTNEAYTPPTKLTLPDNSTAEVAAQAGEIFIAPPTASPSVPTVSGVQFPIGSISYTISSALGGVTTTFITISGLKNLASVLEAPGNSLLSEQAAQDAGGLPQNIALYKVNGGTSQEIPYSENNIPDSWSRTDVGNTTTINLTLKDGGPFDLDGVANGQIVDPVAIAVPALVGDVDLVVSALSSSSGRRQCWGQAAASPSPIPRRTTAPLRPRPTAATGTLSTSTCRPIPNITTSDSLIGYRNVFGTYSGGKWGLDAGASDSATTTVTVPGNLAPGTYYIGAIADVTNDVTETNENNNALAGATITVEKNVDLVMTAVTKTATSVGAGGSFTISDTEKNIGTDKAIPNTR